MLINHCETALRTSCCSCFQLHISANSGHSTLVSKDFSVLNRVKGRDQEEGTGIYLEAARCCAGGSLKRMT